MPPLASRLARAAVAAAIVLAPAALRAQAAPPAAPAAGTRAPSHLAAATELLEATHTRDLMQTTAEQTLQSQLQQMPQLQPYADVIRKFYQETMDWSVLGPEFVRLYAETFTEAELREITAFYRTPIGAKMLEKLPQVMARSNQIATARLQEAMPRLMERLQQAERAAGAPKPQA